MKSITLITKTKITADKVSQKLIDGYNWKKKIVQNNEKELFLGFFPREFYIVYDDSSNMDSSLSGFDESDKEKIPFDNPIINELYCRDSKVIRNIIGIILEEYPELYICCNDNIMTASEYIEILSK